MNVYMEHAGTPANIVRIRRLRKLLKPEEQIELFLRSDRFVSLLGLVALVAFNRPVRSIELTLPPEKLSFVLTRFANRSPGIDLCFAADRLLRDGVWRRMQRLDGTLTIRDSSGGANRARYDACLRTVATDAQRDDLAEAEAYALAAGMPTRACRHSSCLGKTVFISGRGELSFCPEHPEETRLGPLRGRKQLFDGDLFRSCLTAMIQKRGVCKGACPRYAACGGGCPFEGDCSALLARSARAEADMDACIARAQPLHSLPAYKRQAIVYKLFQRKIPAKIEKSVRKEEPYAEIDRRPSEGV